MKALPIEFLCRANLVGEAEVVSPALLLGAPAAAPAEIEDERGAVRRLRLHRPDEIGTARRARYRHALDGQVRLGGEHELQKSLNFDSRQVGIDANARSVAVSPECSNVCFELLVRLRSREQRLQLPQFRPPTAAGLGD